MSRVGILPEAGVRYLAGGDDDQKALVVRTAGFSPRPHVDHRLIAGCF